MLVMHRISPLPVRFLALHVYIAQQMFSPFLRLVVLMAAFVRRDS